MDDWIDRQAAIVRTSKVIKDDGIAHDVKEALKGLPSAQPEIICCKDCKFYGKADNMFYRKKTCLRWRHPTTENDYCSNAERKDK